MHEEARPGVRVRTRRHSPAKTEPYRRTNRSERKSPDLRPPSSTRRAMNGNPRMLGRAKRQATTNTPTHGPPEDSVHSMLGSARRTDLPVDSTARDKKQ